MFLDIRCLGGGKVREKFVAPVVKRLFLELLTEDFG